MSYHFIGLGGIGMSALARILIQKGEKVQGSDMAPSTLLEELKNEGAKVQIGHSNARIDGAKTVIYSTAVKEDNVELKKAIEHKIPMLHRADLLNELMKGKKNLLVTGTHGKTTTSALLASVLMEADLDPSFVVGALVRSLNTNGRYGCGEYFVAEADESDGSFLKTPAFSAILTNLSNDHLDYWGSERVLNLAFKQFIGQCQDLFWCYDDDRLRSLNPKGTSYGFSREADVCISNFEQTNSGIVFDLGNRTQIKLNLLGKHNALNGAAVFSLALSLGISESVIRGAFQKFLGTSRRLEFKGEAHKVSLYDDYGHHPREIKATLKALRDHIKERRLVVLFQPHRYSRVRDLFNEFTTCFDDADVIFLTDIYGAGEALIANVSSVSFYTHLRSLLGPKVHFLPRSHLERGVGEKLQPLDILLTLGPGDITKSGPPILSYYSERKPKYKVGLLYGGESTEHAVSKMSAKNIFHALDKSVYDVTLFGITPEGEWVNSSEIDPLEGSNGQKISPETLGKLSFCDVCIPVLHGPKGEDGMVGAILEALHIPFIGCDFRSGALCMNKVWTKYAAEQNGIKTAPFLEVYRSAYKKNPMSTVEEIEEKLTFPLWVKPVHLGSSIGVNRAENRNDLEEFIRRAFSYDEQILIEEEIEGRQIEFSLLGNEFIRAALPAEIINHGNFVGFDEKYGPGAMEICVPALITEEQKSKGIELSKKMYRACKCQGLARIDFFLDKDGSFWLNEINPFPGFTDTSAYPKAWQGSCMQLEIVLDELIALAFHRARV